MTTFAIALQRIPAWVRHSLLIGGASLLIGLFSHLAIPLPFTPIPVVMQNSLILFLAIFLGSRRILGAVSLFLMQGIAGFPVFSNGASGLLSLTGPRGGYLIGYLAAAFFVGWILERQKEKNLMHAAGALFAGHLVIYILGATWLATFVGMEQAFLLGVLPFVLGDLCKLLISLKLLQVLRWDRG